MVVLEIVATRPHVIKDSERHSELGVESIESDLCRGDRFVLWETHHQVPVIIRKIAKGEITTLSASCSLRCEDWHVVMAVDTDDPEAGRKDG